MERLLGILGIPTGLGLPLLEPGRLLGHPLLGDSKLGAHILMQLGLFIEAVPFFLLLAKELGFLPATSDKGLKEDQCQNTKIHEERRKREERLSEYLASRNDDIT